MENVKQLIAAWLYRFGSYLHSVSTRIYLPEKYLVGIDNTNGMITLRKQVLYNLPFTNSHIVCSQYIILPEASWKQLYNSTTIWS